MCVFPLVFLPLLQVPALTLNFFGKLMNNNCPQLFVRCLYDRSRADKLNLQKFINSKGHRQISNHECRHHSLCACQIRNAVTFLPLKFSFDKINMKSI